MKWIYLVAILLFAAGGRGESPMEETNPRYLYKILSLKNWQETQSKKRVVLSADDEKFVHFSREDQLERIISKYWSDAREYVVLKIETQRLQGELVYETNPGGAAKYYHLYRGCIPYDAIIEAKIYQNHTSMVRSPG